MASVSRPRGLPLKLHSSQGLFFPKTAILMLRERFLIAENTCEKFFPRFARTDRRFAPLRYEWAVPLLLCRCRPCAKYRSSSDRDSTFAEATSGHTRSQETPPALPVSATCYVYAKHRVVYNIAKVALQ